jgi:hypothetical protein
MEGTQSQKDTIDQMNHYKVKSKSEFSKNLEHTNQLRQPTMIRSSLRLQRLQVVKTNAKRDVATFFEFFPG